MATISNGSATPLNERAGTVPQMNGTLQSWYQPMIFTRITKTTIGFEVIETKVETAFRGVIQPFTSQQLVMKPEGQRAWSWYSVHSAIALELTPDEVINYLGVQYRIMARRDYKLYGYLYYEMIVDYTGSGPYAP